MSSPGYSLIPYTSRGFAGINVGQSNFKDFSCGASGFGCDDSATRIHAYFGGFFNEWVGVQLGALYEGGPGRAGGTTRAEGLNASLVARVPIGAFNVFAKGGATYGRTRVTADALSGITPGRKRGFGGSYGFGAGYDITANHGVVLEWERHAFNVPGGGRRDIDSTSLGYVYRF